MTPRQPSPAARSGRKKGLPVLPFVLGGLILVGVLAVVLSVGGSKKNGTSTSAAETRPVEVQGAKLAPLPQSGPDPTVGSLAPTLTGRSFDGTPVSVEPGKGRPVIVMFLAHWCPHCQREVPVITSWIAQKGKPQGVDLVAVSTNVDRVRPNYPPSAWLARDGFPVPTLADDTNSSAAAAYGVSGFPFFAYVGKDGRIVGRASGEIAITELEQVVATLTQ